VFADVVMLARSRTLPSQVASVPHATEGRDDVLHGAGVGRRWRRLGAPTAAAALTIAVASGWTSAGGAAATGPALRKAIAATNRAYEGTSRAVDATPRPAVKGKHLVIVSAGQSSISTQVPTDAAVDAAETIGWNVDVYDGKLTPANYPQLVRQAIAVGADAIMLVAIDCQDVKQPLEEARAKRIVVTAISAFDCSDPAAGGANKYMFNASINYGASGKTSGAFVASYGTDQANYIIAKSNNKAKVLLITGPEFTALHYVDKGFRDTIGSSHGSTIVSTLNITLADFLNSQLVTNIEAELLRHPDVNWIRSPFTYATTLGVIPALGSRAASVDVMGGEGYAPEIDLLRAGKITAVNVIPAGWESWAAIDTLNSAFRREKPADAGFGWTMTDRGHNLPVSGMPEPSFDYKTAYEKAWGVV
jgi:ribose transport system substrate-binding protein